MSFFLEVCICATIICMYVCLSVYFMCVIIFFCLLSLSIVYLLIGRISSQKKHTLKKQQLKVQDRMTSLEEGTNCFCLVIIVVFVGFVPLLPHGNEGVIGIFSQIIHLKHIKSLVGYL